MAIADDHSKGVRMINVVMVSRVTSPELTLLRQQLDMNVSIVELVDIDQVIRDVAQYNPDIIIIEDSTDNISADMLCHFLSQHYAKSQCLILTNTNPTFEMLQNSGFKARGYITSGQRAKLDKAVRVVHDGEAWLPRSLVAAMLDRFAASFYMTENAAC